MVPETVEHLFVKCKFVKRIWLYIAKNIDHDIPILRGNEPDFKVIITNKTGFAKHISNFIVLVVKQFIYRCRCQEIKPSINTTRNEIILQYNIGKYVAKQEGKIKAFQSKWEHVNAQLLNKNENDSYIETN